MAKEVGGEAKQIHGDRIHGIERVCLAIFIFKYNHAILQEYSSSLDHTMQKSLVIYLAYSPGNRSVF